MQHILFRNVQVLERKTNNFQKELFDYIISDIRDFIEDVEFEIENPEKEPDLIIDENTGYPTQASAEELSDYQRTIITTIRNLPDYYPIYDDTFFNFKDEESLKDRVENFTLSHKLNTSVIMFLIFYGFLT